MESLQKNPIPSSPLCYPFRDISKDQISKIREYPEKMGRSESLRGWRHRKIGFSMDPGLKVGSIASRGGGQATRRDFEEVPQIARRSLLLWKYYTTPPPPRVPPPPWNSHNREKLSHTVATVASLSIPHSCARKRCRWRSRIISGQLHDFPEYGLNKYGANIRPSIVPRFSLAQLSVHRRMRKISGKGIPRNLTFQWFRSSFIFIFKAKNSFTKWYTFKLSAFLTQMVKKIMLNAKFREKIQNNSFYFIYFT